MRSHSPLVLLAALLAVLAVRGDAQSATTITLPADFSDSLVASVALPTALAFTPDGRLLITTQPGQLRVYENGALVGTPALDLNNHPIDICTTSERGLLGVAVDPNFASNGYIYLYWSAGTSGNCRNRVSRFTMTGNTAALGSELILVDNIPAPLGTHNAGDVHVGKDGNLYVSVGDGGCNWEDENDCSAANGAARGMHALVGKIVRITRTGDIPADNPFQGAGTVRCNTGSSTAPNKCREIFATGLRNPFRIAFDPNAAGTRFFINDVGQNTWEEIDEAASGADYGWNVREGPCVTGSTSNCGPPPAGMTNPIFWYQQGQPSGCRAVTGGAFVPSGIWPAVFEGAYLFADYVCGRIFRLNRQDNGTYVRTDFATGLGSNSAVAMIFGPYQGTQALYYTTYEGSGTVRRIAYTGTANRPPTAMLSAAPTSGPAPLEVDFDGSGSSDPDSGDTLTYEWDFGDGQTASGASPTISHTYAAAGTFTASLRVRDNHGALSTPATVQIQPGNTAPTPVIETPASGATFRVGQNVVLHGSATDPQEGTLPASRLSWQVLRHHGTSHTHPWLPPTPGNDIPISTPGPEDLATTTTSFLEVRLTATDSSGLATTVTREFRPTLVDLTFSTVPAALRLVLNGEQVTAPFTFSSWEAWQFPASALRQQDGGGATWVFDHWSDGAGATHTITTGTTPASYTATFRPNAAPVATGSSVSTEEDTATTVTLNATDADGDPISRAIERNPANGTLGAIQGSSVVYTPNAQSNGPDSFDFSASDGAATSPDATVSITVTEVNDPPDAVNDTTSLAEDGSVLVNVRGNDSKGPSNESAQTLTLSSATVPLHGTATIESGSVRYQPAANYFGPDSFGYQVCDNGTTNGSPAPLCDSATVSVTVTPVNDAPVAVDDAKTTPEDTQVLFAASTLAVNDADVDGNPLTVTAVTPGAQTNGTVGLSAGQVTYTPAANFNGQGRFDYTVSDGAGGTDTGTVVVTVTPVNDPPGAVDDVRAATEDVAATFSGASLAANDTDIDGGTLTVTGVSPRADTHGTVGLAAGQVTYTPAANFNGVARFDYTVSDGAGGTDTGMVTVNVAAVNDPPAAADDTATTPESTAVVVNVLANDTPGPADESGQLLTVSTVGTPAHGTAVRISVGPDAGKVLYTPTPGYSGSDSFTYQACDNGSGAPCDSATVAMTVGQAAPVATDVVAAAIEDVEVAIDLVGSDPNGDELTFAVVTGPAHGTIVTVVGRTVRYLPASNYHGLDSFTFRASDGGLQSNVATASLTVHPVNDAPTAVPDVVRAGTDAPVLVDVLANDSPGPMDESGQALRLSGVGVPGHGTATAVDGRILYTPSPDNNGPVAFQYTVCDDGSSGGAPDPRCATAAVDFAFSAFPLPVNDRAPRVVGGARAGTVAVAVIGEWHAAPLAVEYRWLRCPAAGRSGCTTISGAVGERYRVKLADVGRVLRVLVTVRNRFGPSAATSPPIRSVASPVVIAAVRHRGDDWVLLKNQTRTNVPLQGWGLSDAGGAVHTLGRVTIGPLHMLRVNTRNVWGARDRATLRLPDGRTADICVYRAPRAAVATC